MSSIAISRLFLIHACLIASSRSCQSEDGEEDDGFKGLVRRWHEAYFIETAAFYKPPCYCDMPDMHRIERARIQCHSFSIVIDKFTDKIKENS